MNPHDPSSFFRLVDHGWEDVLREACEEPTGGDLLIACPFIKVGPLRALLSMANGRSVRVLTRLDEMTFYQGVSDLRALQLLLEYGAEVRGLRHLHAKLFVFGASSAVVGSANLTQAAWTRNHEFGFVGRQPDVVAECQSYFEGLWRRSSAALTQELLDAMDDRVTRARELMGTSPVLDLRDHGSSMPELEETFALQGRAFVKFFGQGHERKSWDLPVLEEVHRSGCHYACTYPRNKTPKQAQDGDTMFLGRFVGAPNDLIIYGRAIAVAHRGEKDRATDEEMSLRPWKEEWPNYVRVHSAQFLNGTLREGVRLSSLIAELDAQAFSSTAERVRRGEVGVNPRRALGQQPHVQLTPAGHRWVTEKLEQAMAAHGTIPQEKIDGLDWPKGART